MRPGFEDAVALYMATGLLWNAGQMPTLGSALYLSIADELMPRKPSKEGKAWLTRVPTSLTILQAGSIGLEVTKALPCNCEDLSDFEDPAAVPCNPKFTLPIPPIVMDGADNEDVPSE